MVCIVASSALLAAADPKLPEDTVAEAAAGVVFTIVFLVECVAKLLAQRMYYFHSPWNLLDLVVVVEGVISLVMDLSGDAAGGGGSVKVLLVLGLLEFVPILRTVSHHQHVYRSGPIYRV